MAFTYNLTVNFPNSTGAEVQAMAVEIATYLGWTVQIDNGDGGTIPNPISAAEWVRKAIAQYLRDCLKAQRAKQAEITRQQQLNAVEELNIN